MSSEDPSPYAPPRAEVEEPEEALPEDALALRREHHYHEESLRALGVFHVVMGLLAFVVLVCVLTFLARGSLARAGAQEYLWAAGASMIALAFLPTGYGLSELQDWGRLGSIPACLLGMLAFPVGTIAYPFILYLLFSEKGRTVCTPEYRQIRAATEAPQTRSKPVTIALVGFFLLLLVLLSALV